MRLIVKQAQISVLAPDLKVRVEFTRNAKSLSTDLKPVEEATGIAEIKQSFNQKMIESFDNQAQVWAPDLVELSLYCGTNVVGVCRFDLTKYVDKGAKTEKVCMIEPGQEPLQKD